MREADTSTDMLVSQQMRSQTTAGDTYEDTQIWDEGGWGRAPSEEGEGVSCVDVLGTASLAEGTAATKDLVPS